MWLGIAVLGQMAWTMDVAGNSSVRTGGMHHRCGREQQYWDRWHKPWMCLGRAVLGQVTRTMDAAGNSSIGTGGTNQKCDWE